MSIYLMLLSGFGIGLVSGVLGIGGGTLLVPLFVFAFRMNMVQAVGTSLAVIAPIALFGAVSHHLRGHVQLQSVLWVALAAAVGMACSAIVIEWIPTSVLRKGFAVFLMVVAVKLLIR